MIVDEEALKTIAQPSFKKMEAKIAPHYAYFNKSTTNSLLIHHSTEEMDPKVKADFITNYGVREINSRRVSSVNSKGAEIEHSLQIVKLIHSALIKNIVNMLPQKPICKDQVKQSF